MINKQISSYFGVDLRSCVTTQHSNILAVLLPGIGYTTDRPLLDYSKKLCLELGYDVLPIEYGFQAARKECNVYENHKIILKESLELLNLSLDKKYEEIIFIGKSFGTVIQNSLCDYVLNKNYKVKNIYLTPVDETVKMNIKPHSLVISGTKDPLICAENIDILKNRDDLTLILMKGCDHSLNVKDNAISSINYLAEIISAEKNYIINRY